MSKPTEEQLQQAYKKLELVLQEALETPMKGYLLHVEVLFQDLLATGLKESLQLHTKTRYHRKLVHATATLWRLKHETVTAIHPHPPCFYNLNGCVPGCGCGYYETAQDIMVSIPDGHTRQPPPITLTQIHDSLFSKKKPDQSSRFKLEAPKPPPVLVLPLLPNQETHMNKQNLPREIMLEIFSYLSPDDLAYAGAVCRVWHSISLDKSLWIRFLRGYSKKGANGASGNKSQRGKGAPGKNKAQKESCGQWKAAYAELLQDRYYTGKFQPHCERHPRFPAHTHLLAANLAKGNQQNTSLL